jgi:hypothetical protein
MPGLFLHQSMKIWQGCIEKNDDVVELSTRYKNVNNNRWDIFMLHLWPGSGWVNAFDSTSNPNCPNNLSSNVEDMWEYPDFTFEAYGGGEYATLYKIQGVTKDSGGNPLGGVTVELFRTLDDTKQNSVVSDDAGNYLLMTRYPDAHYIVAFKSPNLAGSTVQTLVGS